MSTGFELVKDPDESAANITGALPPLPTMISTEHIALLAPALRLLEDSQNKLQAAQQEFAQAQLSREAAAGAVRYVADFLRAQYEMGPGDDIDREGNILRKGA